MGRLNRKNPSLKPASPFAVDVLRHRVYVQVPQLRDLPQDSNWQRRASAPGGCWRGSREGAGAAAPAAGCPASPQPSPRCQLAPANACCRMGSLQSCLPGRDLAWAQSLLPASRALARAALSLGESFVDSGKVGTAAAFLLVCSRTERDGSAHVSHEMLSASALSPACATQSD